MDALGRADGAGSPEETALSPSSQAIDLSVSSMLPVVTFSA